MIVHNRAGYEEVLKQDEMIRGFLREIESVLEGHPIDKIDTKELVQRQIDLFRRMVSFAVSHSEFYSQLLGGHSFRTSQDIAHLPRVTKEDILKYHVIPLKKSLSRGLPNSQIKTPMMTASLAGAELWTTSGSTGSPTVVVRHPTEYDYAGISAARAMSYWITPDDRVANLMTAGAGWGTSTMTKSTVNHTGAMTQLLGNKMTFEALYESFKMFSFNCIYALPSWTAEFFSWLETTGKIQSFPKIDKLFFGGESPHTFVQTSEGPKTLSEYANMRWGGKIISLYGGTEIGSVGLPLTEDMRSQCGFHVLDDTGYTELLEEDGTTILKNGETGSIVTTRFISALLPLIRFETKDACTKILDYGDDVSGLRAFIFPRDGGCRADDTVKLTSQNVYGFGKVMDELVQLSHNNIQLVVSKNPFVAGGQTMDIRTMEILSPNMQMQIAQVIKTGLKKLLSGQGKDSYIDTIHFSFQTGFHMTTTGKFRRVVNLQ